jgi:hypothetical protein
MRRDALVKFGRMFVRASQVEYVQPYDDETFVIGLSSGKLFRSDPCEDVDVAVEEFAGLVGKAQTQPVAVVD